jgi:hypothetical protein
MMGAAAFVRRATAFRGGSMRAWYGGIEIKTPPGWRVESELKTIAGGVQTQAPVPDDPAARVLTLTGTEVLGGISVGSGTSGKNPATASAAAA